uniref:uncharacterized protein LOC132683725 n=1 Tax=Panthera onca TaxID=9690 RepID=UPI002955AC29|nr:uncharacterized protein LOC132683725 [Panthera onca]
MGGGGGLRGGPEGELGEGRKRKSSARVVEKKSRAVESHSRSRSVLLPINDQSWPTASRVQRLRRRLQTRRPQGRAAEWGKQGSVPAPDLLIRLAALPPRTRSRRVSSLFNLGGRKEVVRNVRQSPGPWEIGNRGRAGLVPRTPAPRAQPEVGSPAGHHPSLSPPLARPSEGPSALVPGPSFPPRSLPLPTERSLLAELWHLILSDSGASLFEFLFLLFCFGCGEKASRFFTGKT